VKSLRTSFVVLFLFLFAPALIANAAPATSVMAVAATPVASPSASPESAHSGRNSVYLTIRNNGTALDTLIGGSTPVAQTMQVHTMEMQGGILTMANLPDGLEIPAGETVVLEPGAYHLMLIDLKQDIVADSTFELTLTFQHAGDVTLTVPVQANAPDEGASEVPVGDLVISAAWARPIAQFDDCGCGVPDAAKKYIPTIPATPAA
jgi:copper(I)-binding protein